MHRPGDLAEKLNISPATLRLWSNHFAAVLSPGAQKSTTEMGTAAQRRYTEQDLAYFQRAKHLLNDGKTYEETLTALQEEPPSVESPPSFPSLDGTPPSTPPPAGDERGMAVITDDHPAMRLIQELIQSHQEALRAKDETIETLHLALTSKERDLELIQTMKDQTIFVLEKSLSTTEAERERLLEELAKPAPTVAPTRFRWDFLNRLLLDNKATIDEGKS